MDREIVPQTDDVQIQTDDVPMMEEEEEDTNHPKEGMIHRRKDRL
tara:strand:- start:1908 stop:2042 length:135 start_codon:yes stop_codon:yes gene_type:complete